MMLNISVKVTWSRRQWSCYLVLDVYCGCLACVEIVFTWRGLCVCIWWCSGVFQVDRAIDLCSEMHDIREAIYENKRKLEGIGEDYQIQVRTCIHTAVKHDAVVCREYVHSPTRERVCVMTWVSFIGLSALVCCKTLQWIPLLWPLTCVVWLALLFSAFM